MSKPKTWRAEDLPTYALFKGVSTNHLTGEDFAMGTPRVLAEGVSENQARSVMSDQLYKIANMSHIQAAGLSASFRFAAQAIESGADGFQFSGRYYRVIEED
jgi:hypothetical protein